MLRSGYEGPRPEYKAGYLKAVWPDFLCAFLKSGRPRGPGEAFQSVESFAPHISEGLPGPPELRYPGGP